MFRPLSTFPLPVAAQTSLRENGFSYCEDIISHRGVVPEARNILHKWNLHSTDSWHVLTKPAATLNSLDLWQEECINSSIVTWSEEVDSMLGGGVPLKSVTEFCGAPGTGKTQMCLQLCVDVQIPQCLGGVEGEAVFIDTSSNFSPQRLRDIADACCHYCQLISESLQDNQRNSVKHFNSDSILNGIHFVSIHGIINLLASIKLLPELIQKNPKIRLIVIDSLAFSLNCGETYSSIDRTNFVYRILADLQRLAVQKNIAVVVTNQLTTRVIRSGVTKCDVLPALGESMGHCVTRRIFLGRVSSDVINAISLKGHNQLHLSAKFKVTKCGVRDVHVV